MYPAIPLMARDSSLVGMGILLILFKDVHTEVSCGLSLQKIGIIGMRLSALYYKNSSQASYVNGFGGRSIVLPHIRML